MNYSIPEPDCGLLTGGAAAGEDDEDDSGYLSCPPAWDTISCWPRTRAGSEAVIPCFEEFNSVMWDTTKNATKWCWDNGTWERYSNYSHCTELEPRATSVEIMSQLYLIGYGLSLSTLTIAVFIYLYYRELRCLRNTIHTNLMFTYILADFTYILVTMPDVATNKLMCNILIPLYHYLQLTNFFWMFVEGLYLYLLVVKTFSGDNIKLRTCLFIGWGIPLIVVFVWCMAKFFGQDFTTLDSKTRQLADHCIYMVEHPFDYIYQGTALTILGVNVIFLFMIMWVLITKLRTADNDEAQQYKKAAKALLVLIPLLGVTYILFVAGPTEGQAASVFQYTRAVLLSTQGFSIAIFYCFLNNEVRNTLRHHYQRWSTARSLGAGQRYYAHWAPRSRTESVRLYCRPSAANNNTTTDNNYSVVANNGGGNGGLLHCANGQETTISEAVNAMTLNSGCGNRIVTQANVNVESCGDSASPLANNSLLGRFKNKSEI